MEAAQEQHAQTVAALRSQLEEKEAERAAELTEAQQQHERSLEEAR